MQAIATPMALQRGQNPDVRTRALVRFNGLTFHGLATASFLDTAVPLHVSHLVPVFAAYPGVQLWLDQVWWPGRAEIGRQLREHVETIWPEFDWNSAYREFRESSCSNSGLRGQCATVTHVALGLCVSAAQAAVFYRALARSADEPALRDLAHRAARDHAGYFEFFRDLFEHCRRRERVGLVAAWRTAIAISRAARDGGVAAAFAPLGRNWNGSPVIPALDYPEFRGRMAQFILRHVALGPIERLMFRPWLERVAPVRQAASFGTDPRLSITGQQYGTA